MDNKKYCELCNKYYKNIYSFSNHKRLYHTQKTSNLLKNPPQNPQNNSNEFDDNLNCNYCNKIFSRKDNLKRHFNSCKEKKRIDKEQQLSEENKKLKDKIKEDEKNIKKLENKVENIEKMLDYSNLGNNTTHNNNNYALSNNYDQTNNVLIQLGKENVIDVMPKSDQIKILNTCYNSLYRLVKELHCGDKYPQFRNLAITNLSDNYGHRYDDKLKSFVKCHKNDLIETLIENRIVDIEDILNANIDEISEEKAKKLIILIEEITEKRGCYKNKKEQIKLLIYNECKIKL